MNDTQSKSISLPHPADTFLAAYKDWIVELCKRLTTKEMCIFFTEEEWVANWKAYWKEQPAG